ncbi:DUF2147 domain-containing protein [Paucibacter sp. O1-1]|nr:DUF2147 domain-containing protein [Paucibacter sp. O1-1]MDA3828776.1 DUF2147 domain-containing protein [Paucibacter sp. O1-1]
MMIIMRASFKPVLLIALSAALTAQPARAGEAPNPKCDKCEGALKNTPVVGLVILSGLTREGDDYVGGQILDTDKGKVYRSKLRLMQNGQQLSVRGYIGVPILGRSQTWLRQE